jgi:hypothetical protein
MSAICNWVDALLLVAATAAASGETIVARASCTSGFAPQDVVIYALIERDARNRSVEFVVESESFYTSSTAELDGDRAPRLKQVWFRQLPAGEYKIRVTLRGTQGERGVVALWCDLL